MRGTDLSNSLERCRRVLVIEDDQDTRFAILEALAVLGYADVVAVATGAATLNAMIQNPEGFPVAIVDIYLPDMTAKFMAKSFPAKHGIKTLILYSGGRGDVFAAARAAFEGLGISEIHYLKKPATLKEFQELLNRPTVVPSAALPQLSAMGRS
jgi:DNA-binding NtrC family response regulator